MAASGALLLLGFGLVTAQETTLLPSDYGVFSAVNSPRIVGGQAVTDRSQYAYQVSLRYYGSHFCGGSIVSSKHVLTAAHCCYINNQLIAASTLSAVVGDLYLTTSSDSVIKNVDSVIVHEEYNASAITNDVAIMQLTSTFDEWTNTINLIALASTAPEVGTNCVVSGWGYTQESGRISEVLQTVTVPVVSSSTCALSYGDSIQNGMICAGYTAGGRDACQGDSGGPMVCDSVLAGVVSWGYGCAREDYPGVYTDVAYYRSWIEERITVGARDNSNSSSGSQDQNSEGGSSSGSEVAAIKLIAFGLVTVVSMVV